MVDVRATGESSPDLSNISRWTWMDVSGIGPKRIPKQRVGGSNPLSRSRISAVFERSRRYRGHAVCFSPPAHA